MNVVPEFDPNSIKNKLTITKVEVDSSHLSANQKKLVNLLIECAKVLEEIFYLQKYPDNIRLRDEINRMNDPKIIHFFKVMCGPFDHLNNDIPYIEGIEKSDKVGFYPADLTKSEWRQYLKKNPDKKEAFISPYTIISREKSEIISIPYCEYFKDYLLKASEILQKASMYADNYTLKSYLSAQANAFVNNDFYEADIRWIQITDNDIVPLLGAYEFYEDKFLGYKASFSAFIGLKNRLEFNKLIPIQKMLDILQERLPIPEHYRKQKRGSISQIEIIDLIFNAGDARSPFPTTAFNLPNSQRIRSEFGSKKVLLFNIMKKKFESVMIPISKIILVEKDLSKVTFESYSNYVLLHEISHELGIGFIKDVDGKMQEVSYFLKDVYTIIEETKADVMGIFSILYLQKQSYINDCTFTEVCITYLVNLFRLIRFGTENAHGLASIIQLNFLKDDEVFILNNNNNIFIDFHKFEKSIEKLLTIILTLQGEGDYSKSKIFIKRYSNIGREYKKYIERIRDLPVDILPWYPQAGEKKSNFV